MLDQDFHAELKALQEAGVDFILVGGLAAVLNGAPVNTYDVDVVHSRHADNVARLLPVLEALDAIYRIQPSRRLRPNASHLASAGHSNLMTKYGHLDFLGAIGEDLTYEDLLPDSEEMDLGEGLRIRVLKLEKLIEIKQQLHGEKDRAVLPILLRTLEEKRKLNR